jgi:CelD/BcsL family acetyltransferase involved in cellulose biosynthesis
MTRRYLALYTEIAQRVRRPARPAPITLEPIATQSELESTRDEWLELWERTPNASMFQRPEWLLPWCRAFQLGALRSVALRRGRRLIGLAPLHVRARTGARVLTLLGTGLSDYPDVLLEPSCTAEALRALSRWIAQDAAFDACEFECLRADSALLRLPPAARFQDRLERAEVAPALELAAPADAWRAALSRKLRTDLQRGWNRAQRAGIERDRGEADPAEYFAALVRLHAACWRARGQPGVLDDAAVQAFHRAAIEAFAARGMLAFCGLRRAGELVAVVYAFRDRGRERLYLSGFDPELAHASVGTLAVAHAIELAAERGAREVDFMRGGEAYKYAWGARDRVLYRRTLAALAAASDAPGSAARARPW